MKMFGASAPLKELQRKVGFERRAELSKQRKRYRAPLQRIPDFVKANTTESETYLEEDR